jgi:demethylmenaquinone methyltransferase/2-methoxy-6-polyprenyl-1,4-benzoquinol methylase
MSTDPSATPAAPTSVDFDLAARAAEADLPTGAAKTAMVRSMFDTIAPRYDLVNRMMTFGLDVRWRRRSARALGLPPGSVVLDLACGTGDFLKILAASGLRPFGMDLSWGMLAANRTGRPCRWSTERWTV